MTTHTMGAKYELMAGFLGCARADFGVTVNLYICLVLDAAREVTRISDVACQDDKIQNLSFCLHRSLRWRREETQ